MIALASVTLARSGRPLFSNLDLQLSERRIGLIGLNGSGKSSLLRLLNGLLLPDHGEVLVAGHSTRDARDMVLAQTGFVFQNPDHQILFPTVGEEIAFGLTLRGMAAREAHARASALLADHGCAGWEGLACQELSEGQKQMVCILSALACEPHTLLLDECFASLDLRARSDFATLLRNLPQRQIMASHDLDLLSDFDRIIWLDEGQVRGDGLPAHVIAAYRTFALGASTPAPGHESEPGRAPEPTTMVRR